MNLIKLVKQIPSEVWDKMQKDLGEYERSHNIDLNYQKYCWIISNEMDEKIGVLDAYTAFAEIYIQDIWVDSSHRGKGYGTQLIREIESYFKNKGFNNINLVTNQFQAPEFYKKCGFKLEFVRKNIHNAKLNKFFFVKFFDDQEQTQGILSSSEKCE